VGATLDHTLAHQQKFNSMIVHFDANKVANTNNSFVNANAIPVPEFV